MALSQATKTRRNKMETKNNTGYSRKLGLVVILVSALAVFAMSAAPAAAAANLAQAGDIPLVARLIVQALDGDKGGALEGAGILIYDQAGAPLEKGLTDKSGTYVTYLQEGQHKVFVTAEGYTESANVVEMTLGFDTELAVKLYSMRVPPGTQGGEEPAKIEEKWLRVYVSDAASARPIANATVLVVDNTEMVMAKELTDADGRFETMLPPGEYKVFVFADGYIDHAQAVQIEATSHSTTVKASLKRNGRTSPGGPATH
jgi:uncharacterized surface anchored protein